MKKSILPFRLLLVLMFCPLLLFSQGLLFTVKLPLLEYEKKKEYLSEYKILKYGDFAYVGEYDTYFKAVKSVYEIREVNQLEVGALFNYMPISLEDAFALLDNRNYQDEVNGGYTLSLSEMDSMLLKVESKHIYYTIQFGLESEEQVNSFFDIPTGEKEGIEKRESNRYSYGKFLHYEEAKISLSVIQNSGLEKAFIVAFDDYGRIPLERAIEIEFRKLGVASVIR